MKKSCCPCSRPYVKRGLDRKGGGLHSNAGKEKINTNRALQGAGGILYVYQSRKTPLQKLESIHSCSRNGIYMRCGDYIYRYVCIADDLSSTQNAMDAQPPTPVPPLAMNPQPTKSVWIEFVFFSFFFWEGFTPSLQP